MAFTKKLIGVKNPDFDFISVLDVFAAKKAELEASGVSTFQHDSTDPDTLVFTRSFTTEEAALAHATWLKNFVDGNGVPILQPGTDITITDIV